MSTMLPKIFRAIFFVIGVFILFATPLFAQESSSGIANNIAIEEKNVHDGDVITYTENKYRVAIKEYDFRVVGVVNELPGVHINIQIPGPSYPLMTSGIAYVNVTTANGPIHKQDPLTSSNVRGAAMKATQAGYIIGTAMEDFTSKDPKEIGQIIISLTPQYAKNGDKTVGSSLLDVFKLSTIATYEQPSTVFKYVASAGVLLLSFILGFLSFGRTATSGIEALGRNPLASKIIQFGIIMNVLITIAIILTGFVIAFVILRV